MLDVINVKMVGVTNFSAVDSIAQPWYVSLGEDILSARAAHTSGGNLRTAIAIITISLIHWFISSLETALLWIAAIMLHFKARFLHIPPSLRFFTVGTDRDQLFRQAFMFALAPLHAFVTVPLLDTFGCSHTAQSSKHWLLRYGRYHLLFLVTFW